MSFLTSLSVSIPYRLATNRHDTFFYERLIPIVSIPYRLATNHFSGFIDTPLQIVSIPYRLATNFCFYACRRLERFQFQFLIGWLQTFTYYLNLVLDGWFQFLIGWLQTCNPELFTVFP